MRDFVFTLKCRLWTGISQIKNIQVVLLVKSLHFFNTGSWYHVQLKIQAYMFFLPFIFVEISWIKIQIRGGGTARRVFYSVCLVFGLQIIHTVLEPRSHSALSPWHRGVWILESYHPMLSLIMNGIHKWDSSGLHLVTTINRGDGRMRVM